jgi:hypothetical protein
MEGILPLRILAGFRARLPIRLPAWPRLAGRTCPSFCRRTFLRAHRSVCAPIPWRIVTLSALISRGILAPIVRMLGRLLGMLAARPLVGTIAAARRRARSGLISLLHGSVDDTVLRDAPAARTFICSACAARLCAGAWT